MSYKTKCDKLDYESFLEKELKNRRLNSPDPDSGSGISEIRDQIFH